MRQGIDISGWQHSSPIDWNAVKDDNIKFVIEKITEGTTYVNPYFAQDYESAKARGIVFNAYVFWHPSSSYTNQLGFVRNHLAHTTATPELDLELIEGQSWEELSLQAQSYLRAEPHALLYSNVYFLSNMGFDHWPNDVRVNRLWLAEPDVPKPTHECIIWQYTWTLTIPGISGYVDGDYFMDDTLWADWAANQLTPTPFPHPPNKGAKVTVTVTMPVLVYGNPPEKNVGVEKCQALLNTFNNHLVVDGIYGKTTYNTVREFQSSKSLIVDGIVGDKTWEALLA